MALKKISIITVTYNGSQWIEKCLSSITQNNKYNAIVIDNNSTDDTCTIIENKFPMVRLVKSPENLGFGQANNIGIKIALEDDCDYVILLNQDAWFVDESLENLIQLADIKLEFGLISPLHLNGQGDKLDYAFKSYIEDRNCPGLYEDALLNKSMRAIYQTTYVNAAAWLLRRSTIERVGLFDSIFFHYGEDDNYLQRTIYHGIKIGICTNAKICHDREIRIDDPKDLDIFKRKLLINFANINSSYPDNRLNYELNKRRIICMLRIVCLNFKIKKHLAEIRIIRKLRKSILNSYYNNRIGGLAT